MAGKGGAWKVAFADFMTAMMAFFLVMWLSAQDKEVLIATSKYFQNPFNSPHDAKSGLLDFESTKPASRESGTQNDSKNTGNTSTAQSIDLQVGLLIGGGDAGIADAHVKARILDTDSYTCFLDTLEAVLRDSSALPYSVQNTFV